MSDAFYLGDSVFVDIENGMVRLYTNNGLGPQNEIFLEEAALIAFIRWVKAAAEKGQINARMG